MTSALPSRGAVAAFACAQALALCSTAAAATITAAAGLQFSGQVATVTADCAVGVAVQGSARIDWGDGSQASQAQLRASGTQLQISGSHAYARAGSYAGTVDGQ